MPICPPLWDRRGKLRRHHQQRQVRSDGCPDHHLGHAETLAALLAIPDLRRRLMAEVALVDLSLSSSGVPATDPLFADDMRPLRTHYRIISLRHGDQPILNTRTFVLVRK